MEIKYFQAKSETGRTLEQTVEVKSEEKREEEKRRKLVKMLSSPDGVSLPIEIHSNNRSETQIFVFRYDGKLPNDNTTREGGTIIISSTSGEIIAGISTIFINGKSSTEPTAFITDKSYNGIGKHIYGNKGVMKIGFSLLAEVLKEVGIKKVEAFITGGLEAEKSRTNAPKIFESGTYAESTKTVEIDSVESSGRKEKILVTTL